MRDLLLESARGMLGQWVDIPADLASVTTRADDEVAPASVGLDGAAVDAIWRATEDLYRTRTQPAIALCLRRRGQVVIDRAIGHARGHGPTESGPRGVIGASAVPARPDTPFCIFSASKAITAALMHELDARNVLRLSDPVVEYIPEFGKHRKHWVTVGHVLTHRAGIPSVPSEYDPLAMAHDWDEIIRVLCRAKPTFRAGRRLAYHAITGGFILAEVARRATGKTITELLAERITDPLGIAMTYGVPHASLDRVATNYFTGFPVTPPISGIIRRALGVPMREAVSASNDPRFLTSVIPSGNIVTTARDLTRFYQLLLDEGQLDGQELLDRRGIRRARVESAYFELDLTLGFPVRYGQGFMLGGKRLSLYGPDTSQAFGHLGFINMIAWADPSRQLAGALLTSGKPIVANHFPAMWRFLSAISNRVPKVA